MLSPVTSAWLIANVSETVNDATNTQADDGTPAGRNDNDADDSCEHRPDAMHALTVRRCCA